jgi:heparosan-N-sulfate-glucuronate 5-epimerase
VGSDSTFYPLELGGRIRPEQPHGYYVDLRPKADDPAWPPAWLGEPAGHRAVAVAQYGLGCYERFLHGDGEGWRQAALRAARHLVREQDGDGGWREPRETRHTFRIRGPWLSAMAQGQGASLLVRLYAETREEELAAAAHRALRPLGIPTREGGVRALLRDRPFLEEYPTEPPSFVLNGGVFALWGVYDVAAGLADGVAAREFGELLDALAANIGCWDTGSWSRYDLYPHPVVNLASPRYHRLHVTQLAALGLLAPRPDLERARERFEGYAASPPKRARALAGKVTFRLLVRKPRRR